MASKSRRDLTLLEAKAREIADVVRTGERCEPDVYPEQVTGGLYLDIRPNREAAAATAST